MSGKLDVIQGVHVHTFGDTREAYDASQCGYVVYASETDYDGEEVIIKDGDVLVVPSEHVVGFLAGAWPIAVTPQHGEFHVMDSRVLIEHLDSDQVRHSVITQLILDRDTQE